MQWIVTDFFSLSNPIFVIPTKEESHQVTLQSIFNTLILLLGNRPLMIQMQRISTDFFSLSNPIFVIPTKEESHQVTLQNVLLIEAGT